MKGLCARGGFVFDITWKDGKLEDCKIVSKSGNLCKIRYGEITKQFETEAGKSYFLNTRIERL